MNAYEDSLLAARFADLAPEPLAADWDEVLERADVSRETSPQFDRSRTRAGRRRRLLVALAAATFAAAAATAAFGLVREFILDQGLVDLPPVEATPSAPAGGELVVSFVGRSATLDLKMNRVFVYADGRVIWLQEGGDPGLLEQRLSAEGVELLRSEVVATGLFDQDLALVTEDAFRGTVRVRNDGRLVRVSWVQRDHLREVLSDFPGTYVGEPATPQQERAIERVDALLADPGASLPASAWQDRTANAYVPARYAVCWGHRPELGPDDPTPALEPSLVFDLLPPAIQDQLRAREPARRDSSPGQQCSLVPTEDARTIRSALDEAGLEKGVVGNGIEAGPLSYRFKAPGRPGHVYVVLEPTLPDGEFDGWSGG